MCCGWVYIIPVVPLLAADLRLSPLCGIALLNSLYMRSHGILQSFIDGIKRYLITTVLDIQRFHIMLLCLCAEW